MVKVSVPLQTILELQDFLTAVQDRLEGYEDVDDNIPNWAMNLTTEAKRLSEELAK